MKNDWNIFELLCNFVNLEDNCLLCSFYRIETDDNMCAFMTETQSVSNCHVQSDRTQQLPLCYSTNSPVPGQQDYPSIVSFLKCYFMLHKFLALVLKMFLTDSNVKIAVLCYEHIITDSQAELFIRHIYNPVFITFFHYWVTFEGERV